MNRDWADFKTLYGNIAGAREAFENACETLYRKKHASEHVSQVSVKQGDGGIDIFIGELGIDPITVIQCKFFLETFGDSQKSQIRDSFDTAINSKKYKLKKWILCIPRVIDIDENSWWFKWKHKKLKEYSKDSSFIKLTNGNALIDLFKELGLYNQIFQITDSLKIAEIYEAVVPKKVDIPSREEPKIVLFNNYTSDNEPFYLERREDIEFNESLTMCNVWLFGKSGIGKTALINRNLIQNKIEYCFCDLSPVTISTVEDVLNEVLYTVEDKFNFMRSSEETNVLKQITQILCKSGSKKTVIVIDELSVKNDDLLKTIANKLVQLVIHFSNYSEQDGLKFVVSTILNPKEIIQNKSKAGDYFQYICCNSWDEYSSQLFDLLCKALKLDLETSKSLIIESSRNSPRILKSIFRKIIIYNHSSAKSIKKAIDMTLGELVE
jgi:hypothetical protein